MTIGLSRRMVHGAFAMLIAGALAACDSNLMPQPAPPSPSTPSSTASSGDEGPAPGNLLILLGTPGTMRLAWLDADRGTTIPLPDDDARWVSGTTSRGLVATAGPIGRIYVTGPLVPGDRPPWREIPVDRSGRVWLGQPLADAVADPAGERIATVAADPSSGFADGHLVILDPSGGPAHALTLPGRWDGRAPAWLGSGRVAVSTRDLGDATGLAIVDPVTDAIGRWGSAVDAFAVSDDGRTLAWQDRDDRRIVAGPLDATLSGDPPKPVPVDPAARLAAQLLLDPGGQRLAIAWLNDAGDTTAYSIYKREATGWILVRSGGLPQGTSRAVLVSLDP